jgi:hypothetical protein
MLRVAHREFNNHPHRQERWGADIDHRHAMIFLLYAVMSYEARSADLLGLASFDSDLFKDLPLPTGGNAQVI